MKILWIHNYKDRNSGMFLWDIYDILKSSVRIDSHVISVGPSIRELWRSLVQIRKRSSSYDVVHAQVGSVVGLTSIFSAAPVVLSLRGTDLYSLKNRRGRATLSGRFRQLLTYIACLRAHSIIVMSERMARDVRRAPFLGRKPVFVVPDPVGTMFLPDSARFLEQGAWSVDDVPLRIFVGSLRAENPIKRNWIIKEAVDLCNAAGVGVELQIVSGGTREDVRGAIRGCDVVALASIHEGWPNIVKEGLVSGLPFISTDVSDLKKWSLSMPGCEIVEPTPVHFAISFVDARMNKLWKNSFVVFHPISNAKKHIIIYKYAKKEK